MTFPIRYADCQDPPTVYPEFVPQDGDGRYVLREADFWTCGFFPGILYLLRERAVRYPQVFPYLGHETALERLDPSEMREQLDSLCHPWTEPIRAMMTRTDTHDMGFILQPSLRKDWELTSNPDSLDAITTGARSLASRYVPSVGAIRSWDALRQADIAITSLTDDCLVIVDSMMNLDLLYYASKHIPDPNLADIATTHARTVMRSLLRPEALTNGTSSTKSPQFYSTFHVVDFNCHTGEIKEHRTAQGYRTDSTWARGQAWAITGFAQTYHWTKEKDFLETSCRLADYFLYRLETSPSCVERPVINHSNGTNGQPKRAGRYVPLWDFDAPIENAKSPLRDSSAGAIAANGMLLLSQSLAGVDVELAERYRSAAIRIVTDTIEYSLGGKARLAKNQSLKVEDVSSGQRFDAILMNATANHNAQDYHRYSDHGLVYGDYYLLEFGNQLLRMGSSF